MKKNILGFMAIAAVAALSLASCNKSQPQVEAKSESKAPAELKIAYVEVDSIMTQYTFAKEYSALLEKKGQNIQATLAQKQQNLQAEDSAECTHTRAGRGYTGWFAEAEQRRAGFTAASEQRVCCRAGKVQQCSPRQYCSLSGCLQQGQEVQHHLV